MAATLRRLSPAIAAARVRVLAPRCAVLPSSRAIAGLPRGAAEDVGVCPRRLGRATPIMERLVREGRLPYARLLVARRGQLVFDSSVAGELGGPGGDDALYRLFSMTKVFTSVAYGALMEKYGASLDEPLAKYLGPKWAEQQVFLSGTAASPQLEPARRPVTARDCLTHTAGLVYPGLLLFHGAPLSVPEQIMIGRGLKLPLDHASADALAKISLQQFLDLYAEVPLQFHPGTALEYGMGHLVIGRVIEVASGMSLKDFMREEVLNPLGCSDAAGWQPKNKNDLQPLYAFASALQPMPTVDYASGLVDVATLEPASQHLGTMHVNDAFRETGAAFFGDGQLVATTDDCLRLTEMLTRRGRTAEGERLLSPAMAKLLMGNCLPEGKALAWNSWGRSALGLGDAHCGPMKADLVPHGVVGYGLGGMTWLPGAVHQVGSIACQPGAYHWQGIAGTMIQADPANELSVVFMSQCLNALNQPELGPVGLVMQAVYQSLDDA